MTTEQAVDKIINAHHRHNLGKIDHRVLYVNIEDAVNEAKREALEEGRKEIIHHWNKAEQRLDGTAQGAVNAIEQFRGYLTQLHHD